MTALRTTYEDAVIAALKAALMTEDLGGVAGGYLKVVEPYDGDLNPDEDDPAILRLMENGTPSVGVTTGDGEYSNLTLDRTKGTLETTLELVVVSANNRSHAAQRRGDSIDSDPGIYQMIEDFRDVLFGQELDVDGAGFANPAREAALIRAADKTVWLLSYEIPMDVDAVEEDADWYLDVRTRINNADDDTIDPVIDGIREFDVPDGEEPDVPIYSKLAWPYEVSVADGGLKVFTIEMPSAMVDASYGIPQPIVAHMPAGGVDVDFRVSNKTTTQFTLTTSYPLLAGTQLDFVAHDYEALS